MEERDDIRIRLTGPDLHQATVEPRSALRLAYAYFHLVGEAARELDEDLRLEGLWVDDNCATLRTRPSDPDVAEESVELAQNNLAGSVRSPRLLSSVQGVGSALKELPEGVGASTAFRRREFTLAVVRAPKPQRAPERLSLRAKVLRAGGRTPMVRFLSRSKEGDMRVAAALLVVAAFGCAPTTSHMRYRVGVDVPSTPEALSCKRECLALYGPCANYSSGTLDVTPEAGKYSKLYGCPGLVSDCLLTCPGAALADNGPGLVPVPVQAERKPTTEETTARLVFCSHHPAGCSEEERFRAFWLCDKNPALCSQVSAVGTEETPEAADGISPGNAASSAFDWLYLEPAATIHEPI
jgi:hypothetical protein